MSLTDYIMKDYFCNVSVSSCDSYVVIWSFQECLLWVLLVVMTVNRVHHLSLISISESRCKFIGYFIVLRSITLANKPRVFILCREHHLIVFFTLWTSSFYFLHSLRVDDMLNIGLLCPLSGVMIIIAKYNGILRLLLSIASHTHIEPIQITDLLNHH